MILELSRARGVAQLAERFRLDLADALARDAELATYLFERPLAAVVQAEAKLEHAALAAGEAVEHFFDLLFEQLEGGHLGRRGRALVLDEVAEVAILFLANRRLQRDRLLRDLLNLAHLVGRDLHLAADLLRGRLAAVLLHQAPREAAELVDRLDHVHGDADGARLVGDGAGDRLADPPRGVGTELVALAVLELLHGADQSDVAFLDQVE